MRKFGFTLAEVLITLGIIGVVAALTAPALVQNTGNAKVGPTLQKIVSTIEVANEQLMSDQDVSDLTKISPDWGKYVNELSKYIKGSSFEPHGDTSISSGTYSPTAKYYDGSDITIFCSGFGTLSFSNYFLVIYPGSDLEQTASYAPKGSFKGKFGIMYVDINGKTTGPNVVGKDLFYFVIDKNGSVIPYGGKTHAFLMDKNDYSFEQTSGEYACNEAVVGNGNSCSGSIFDNNLKVVYQ